MLPDLILSQWTVDSGLLTIIAMFIKLFTQEGAIASVHNVISVLADVAVAVYTMVQDFSLSS